MFEPSPAERAAAFDPYALANVGGVTPPAAPASTERDPWRPTWVAPARTWAAPFLMAFINSRVARRSAALRPDFYGAAFKHTEMMAVKNAAAAYAASVAFAAAGAALTLAPFRALLKRLAPPQGSGPSMELCKGGHWEMAAYAASPPDAATGRVRVFKARGGDKHRDPGYWGTARMMLELGLAMAFDSKECEAAGCLKGGFLTPATAGGPVLVERLRKAGLFFEVGEVEAK
jgi:short subunit dehydrogenase-like uncharacterized protein